ncbi:TonB-dependent receptor domain-containing protein [Acidobacteriota bacterium]
MDQKNINQKLLIFFIILFLFMLSTTSAQRLTGKIVGSVTDESGIPLPGVTVDISSPAIMGIHSQLTSENGFYRFTNLNPGVYRIVFKLDGFKTVERENLRVSVNTTVTENMALSPVTLEESVIVTAEAPVVDVTKSSITINYDKDSIEKIPTGRGTFISVIKQNPGFATVNGGGSDRIVAFGSNSEENAWFLDGVDIGHPGLGTPWLLPMEDVFEEVEVSGIGSAAEYGNFSGAVVNVVTKSGGNNLSGSAGYYGQFKGLTGDNNPDKDRWESPNLNKSNDIAFTLGAPIIKDRIWFFGGYQKIAEELTMWQDDPEYPLHYNQNNQLFKLSSQIAINHRLVFSYYHEARSLLRSPDDYIMPESIGRESHPVHSWNAIYTYLINKSAYLEIKYSGYDDQGSYMPVEEYGGDVNQPVHYDTATDITSNGLWWPWEYSSFKHSANVTLSYFAEDFLGGNHDFKFGVQYGRGSTEMMNGYGGGQLYVDWYNEPFIMFEYMPNVWCFGGTVNSISAFVDDSWKVSRRLTVNFGLRYDHHNAHIPAFPIMDSWETSSRLGDGIDDLIVWNSISPRIGIAFQLTSDHKTLFRASLGRYRIYPYIANWDYPGPNVPDWNMWFYIGDEWLLANSVPGEQGYSVDPQLMHPYADQIFFGLERELFSNFSISLAYIYKNAKNNIGFTNIGGTYEEVQKEAVGNGEIYSVWNQLNPGEEVHYLTNPEDWGQTYSGLILSFHKRYSSRWMLDASLTWSKAKGLNLTSASTGFYGQSQSLVMYNGKFGVDPNQLINAEGYLNLDRNWIFKLSAGYTFPLDILASMYFTYQTGKPRLTFVRIVGLNQNWWTDIIADERGIDRFDDVYQFDFRLMKTFRLYKNYRLHVMADVFNLFNTGIVYNYRSYAAYQATYLEPSSMQWPRSVQIGIKLEF